MLELFSKIQNCLAMVFLVGLFTGIFFIRRLIKEEYLPLILQYKDLVNNHKKEIKEKTIEIENLQEKIAKDREEIKRLKKDQEIYSNDLLNIEHIYAKESDKKDKLEQEVKESKKILKSLQKEYEFFENRKDNKESIEEEIKLLEAENEQLSKEHKNLVEEKENIREKINHLSDKLSKTKENLKKIEDEILEAQKIIENFRDGDERMKVIYEIAEIRNEMREIIFNNQHSSK